jgi:hypothetical protein
MCTTTTYTKKFKELGACGWAFWNYLRDSLADFNFIKATKYLEILKTAVANS